MRRLLAIILALSITLSTSGFMVYVHHCKHMHKLSSSLIINLTKKNHSFCNYEEQRCCTHDTPNCSSNDTDNNNHENWESCCDDFEFLLKYSPDIEPAKRISLNLDPFSNILFITTIEEPVLSDRLSVKPIHVSDGNGKPGLTGRQIVIDLQQLKISC